MAITKQRFSELIKSFNFRLLFNEMGWDNARGEFPVAVENVTYHCKEEALKSGFRIISCVPDGNNPLPVYAVRKKIELQVTKIFQEHLIIYFDHRQKEQLWQLVVRQSGKPSRLTENRFYIEQDPELLFQKARGMVFRLEEEDKITIVDVTSRVSEYFGANSERVTKKFYEAFRKEHKAFIGFIKGIQSQVDKDWYASLMLNRLMFCYFIQKKGFLDHNLNYLRDKLNTCRVKNGHNKFYSFYRDFLMILFHEGLGNPDHDNLVTEFGRIPYLNGGLFDEHELERKYEDVNIDDAAFESVFTFFDQYDWHLDTRPEATGREVNPDVIGYIFEKYINDRASMGAYYTKEDITDYIGRNTILPYLFDETERHYQEPFATEGEIWKLLQNSGDTYIYPAVKHGVNYGDLWFDLPEDIAAGLYPDQPDLVELRRCWNRPAPAEVALPTESWREVIERRKRYAEVRTKIEAGEIAHINDFITYNLNIRQFIQDVIENTADYQLVMHLYKTIAGDDKSRKPMSILDPTCGSGAFLFAALNILEPLYEGLIARMRSFTDDEDQLNQADKNLFKNRYSFFRQVLEQVQNPAHANLEYFIYKSIILRNLYGVDIMREAVEIAKLRLFLKLVSTVEANYRKDNLGLEPLPDIDFNIRAGNTLVGFATESELKKGLDYTFDGPLHKQAIEESSEKVAMAFSRYKEIQLQDGNDFKDFKKAKADLNSRLKELNNELNQLLYKQAEGLKFDHWLETHQPFHWFAEFYEIIKGKGGFDVIIGNPPYVEYSSIRDKYQINSFSTLDSGNLYAYVIERSISIQKDYSYNGMIIPISAYCTERMTLLHDLELNNCDGIYLSNYAERPSKLFEGAERNLTIALFRKKSNSLLKNLYSTYYYKWNSEFRRYLFENITYLESKEAIIKGIMPKISNSSELNIMTKLRKVRRFIHYYCIRSRTPYILYYRNSGGRYWKIITDFQPEFYLNNQRRSSSRESYLFFNDLETRKIAIGALNSSLYFWYYVMHSDARTNNPSDLKDFPLDISQMELSTRNALISKCTKLMIDINKNSIMQNAKYRTGDVIFQQFFPQNSKHIIDEIDTILAKHYGFTPEELDYIINYDIKYRMGRETEEEDN